MISLSRLGSMLYLCHLRSVGHTVSAESGGHTACFVYCARNRAVQVTLCLSLLPPAPPTKTRRPEIRCRLVNMSQENSHCFINPLMGTGNYSVRSNNMKLVHWPLMGGLLHLVQRGGDWVGPQPAQAPLRCTKCNSLPISGQCTNHRIVVQRSVELRF